MSFQLVLPHPHYAKSTEGSIQTFKNHFKAGLASLDPDFPVKEWDGLLKQAFLTLNLLREACMNPKISAYTYLFGQFDFRVSSLAPPGTKVIVHSKPSYQASWGRNCCEAWYVRPSLNHYCCLKC